MATDWSWLELKDKNKTGSQVTGEKDSKIFWNNWEPFYLVTTDAIDISLLLDVTIPFHKYAYFWVIFSQSEQGFSTHNSTKWTHSDSCVDSNVVDDWPGNQ